MTERAEGLYWTSTPEGDDIDVREWSLGLSDYGLGRGWWSIGHELAYEENEFVVIAGPLKPPDTSCANLVFPRYAVSMIIHHNEHRVFYETAQQAIGEDFGASVYRRDDFPDEAEIEKAIATDNVWTIHWYPETPVGFHIVCAATLERALEVARKIDRTN